MKKAKTFYKIIIHHSLTLSLWTNFLRFLVNKNFYLLERLKSALELVTHMERKERERVLAVTYNGTILMYDIWIHLRKENLSKQAAKYLTFNLFWLNNNLMLKESLLWSKESIDEDAEINQSRFIKVWVLLLNNIEQFVYLLHNYRVISVLEGKELCSTSEILRRYWVTKSFSHDFSTWLADCPHVHENRRADTPCSTTHKR